MDKQHTVLFEILNDLHSAMMKGQAQKITGELLRKLVKYTRDHFTAEEVVMAASGYSGLAEHRVKHRVKHRDLIKEVEEFAARYERGESNLNMPLLNFLRDWLTNHILKVDQQYGPWVNKHNVH